MSTLAAQLRQGNEFGTRAARSSVTGEWERPPIISRTRTEFCQPNEWANSDSNGQRVSSSACHLQINLAGVDEVVDPFTAHARTHNR